MGGSSSGGCFLLGANQDIRLLECSDALDLLLFLGFATAPVSGSVCAGAMLSAGSSKISKCSGSGVRRVSSVVIAVPGRVSSSSWISCASSRFVRSFPGSDSTGTSGTSCSAAAGGTADMLFRFFHILSLFPFARENLRLRPLKMELLSSPVMRFLLSVDESTVNAGLEMLLLVKNLPLEVIGRGCSSHLQCSDGSISLMLRVPATLEKNSRRPI